MKEIRSYSSPFNLGHKALAQLFSGKVIVQEKIDGSQFSFGVIDGELFCRSRNQMIYLDKPEMFKLAVDTVKYLFEKGDLIDGYTYRAEFLMKPKHNTLVYDRVPNQYLILYDIDRGDQDYVHFLEGAEIADTLDLEYVPSWEIPRHAPTMEQLEGWLQRKSILGNSNIEGLVFKNYAEFGRDKKVLMGKYVSEKFRETHDGDWKKRNPGDKAFTAMLTEQYATEARWEKAAQHLREAGALEGEMRDIPKLMEEINRDVLDDCGDEIREKLFKHYWKKISRGLTHGMPEWYKEKLAEEALGVASKDEASNRIDTEN